MRLNSTIRPLTKEDFSLYEQMQTGMENDYMLRVWERIADGEHNRLFGLFADGQLASVAGYTIYAKENAMLGRLRSDVRFRGKSFATKILTHAMHHALDNSDIKWISANTEEHNLPAQKVLKKLGLPHVITLYGAETQSLEALKTGKDTWNKVESYAEKRKWIEQTYLNEDFPKDIFPFETHYPFPATPVLFEKDYLDNWIFYENPEKTRFVILWEEFKGNHYLHVTYAWNDFAKQSGLWETVDTHYQELKSRYENSFVWIDLTPDETKRLPKNHPFDLPSPWMLHGKARTDFEQTEASLSKHMESAQASMDELEKELGILEKDIDGKTKQTEELLNKLTQMDE